MSESLFSMLMRVRPGNFPEQIVYEDEKVMAFLDKFPQVDGHTLVVPKEQVEKVHEMSGETAAAVGAALSKVAAKVVAATGCADYNVICNNGKISGQEVPHVHFHIIPRREGDYTSSWAKSIEENRATGNPRPEKLPDEGAFTGKLATMRDAIRS
ncbi:hypothetical protein GUITHDRAFT_93798 [Guillardia theta CCMP2712]|uniref:HIT domain-containing protein n=2 Tax=Guillardia theta TaxID=55529 RepID=L1JHY2_GUITC|nr:hypothetical protein GUITHDRAFT_93798 [Guillardia theta CCMP2712]EKX47754.1 hypothetical protein GUITHDRAFT_93798 [Guillardia theta CCMP2712]|eukprot:XP_005834734.1 hypothetical protein GUITHDRAFT_93798 [Guillardia theta CCMP2712]